MKGVIIVTIIWGIILFTVIKYAENVEGENIWKDWEYDPGPWCERERTLSFIREPANSYSDFSFLFVALFMIYVCFYFKLFNLILQFNQII